MDRNLSGDTPPGQNGPRRDGKEMVLRIPQFSSITEASQSDCLVPYLGHLLGESYLSAEMQLVNSTAPAYWTRFIFYVYINLLLIVSNISLLFFSFTIFTFYWVYLSAYKVISKVSNWSYRVINPCFGGFYVYFVVIEGDSKAPFLIDTRLRCRVARYSFPRIDPLYFWSSPYNAKC